MLFILTVALAVNGLVRRQPLAAGHCQTCGYNLTGNVSGVCPECGETMAERS